MKRLAIMRGKRVARRPRGIISTARLGRWHTAIRFTCPTTRLTWATRASMVDFMRRIPPVRASRRARRGIAARALVGEVWRLVGVVEADRGVVLGVRREDVVVVVVAGEEEDVAVEEEEEDVVVVVDD